MSEFMIRDVSTAYGQKHVILRYFSVAGADPKGRHGQSTANATHLIKVAIETALGRRPFMNIFGNATRRRMGHASEIMYTFPI